MDVFKIQWIPPKGISGNPAKSNNFNSVLKPVVRFGMGDIEMATAIGNKRYSVSRDMELEERSYTTDDDKNDVNDDILGAAGEQAFCIFAHKTWRGGINTFKNADVDEHIQVRTAWSISDRLIIRSSELDPKIKHDDDVNKYYFVLVTLNTTIDRSKKLDKVSLLKNVKEYVIHGFLPMGSELKHKWEWICNPDGKGAAYFVPQKELSQKFYLNNLTNWNDNIALYKYIEAKRKE